MVAKLTIVVATLNQPELLFWCLRTLVNHAPWDFRLMVVDGSSDRAAQQTTLKPVGNVEWDNTGVLLLGENRKAMGAFNAALAGCDTEFIAFLHDDASFVGDSGSFWPRLVTLAGRPNAGMAGPTISNCTGLQHYKRWDLPEVHKAHYLYGACMVFRTETIKSLGGMIEDISPSDDVALAVHALNCGLDIWVHRLCFLMHERHQTYAVTREGDDGERLEKSWNQIVQRFGVRAACEPLFHETEWELAKVVSPTWADFVKKMEGENPR